MGQKSPDAIPMSAWRRRVATVGDMLRDGWRVRSRCSSCGLEMETDLRVVAVIRGPDVSLWNRVGRCRRIGCGGRVSFSGRGPRMSGFRPLLTHADGLE